MLTGIAVQYPWASWAVWDDAFPDGDCVEKRPERLVEFGVENGGLANRTHPWADITFESFSECTECGCTVQLGS